MSEKTVLENRQPKKSPVKKNLLQKEERTKILSQKEHAEQAATASHVQNGLIKHAPSNRGK